MSEWILREKDQELLQIIATEIVAVNRLPQTLVGDTNMLGRYR